MLNDTRTAEEMVTHTRLCRPEDEGAIFDWVADRDEMNKQALRRHEQLDCDSAESNRENAQAFADGDRILSVYYKNDVTFWIITEHDRSSTCILLPSEY